MTEYKMSLLKRIANYMDLTFEYVSDNELYFMCNENKGCIAHYTSFDHAVGIEQDMFHTLPLLNYKYDELLQTPNEWTKRERKSFDFNTLEELDMKLTLRGF